MNMVQDMQDEGYSPYGPASETVEDAREILDDVKDNTPNVKLSLAQTETGEYQVMMKESAERVSVIESLARKYGASKKVREMAWRDGQKGQEGAGDDRQWKVKYFPEATRLVVMPFGHHGTTATFNNVVWDWGDWSEFIAEFGGAATNTRKEADRVSALGPAWISPVYEDPIPELSEAFPAPA